MNRKLDIGWYLRISKHLTDWLMDNYDNISETEKDKLINEIMYYKLIIRIMQRDLISCLN